jgi:cell wall-associated NlpC family hydrolase
VANTGGSGLNCRSGAGTGSGVITVLSLGQSVSTRSGSVSGWTAVVCGGQNGFVSSEFVTGGGTAPAPAPTTPAPAPQPSGMVSGNHAQSTADVNLRYSASLGAGIATVVPNGTVVLITGSASNGFYPVDYDGLGGFMSADYLVKTDAAITKRGGSASPTTPTDPAPAPGGTATGNALVNYAMNYLGYPYVWATHGPSSFDCSGFTSWVVQNVMGKSIGYGTWTQVSAGTPVSRTSLQPGDLVFFQNTYTAGLSHVGLYIGGNQFIHAQNEDTGVVISSLDSSYYSSRWYGAVRL